MGKEKCREHLISLKNSTFSSSSHILPEMMKARWHNVDFIEMVLYVLSSVWQERVVPQEWADTNIVPIPKKCNLKSFDNW